MLHEKSSRVLFQIFLSTVNCRTSFHSCNPVKLKALCFNAEPGATTEPSALFKSDISLYSQQSANSLFQLEEIEKVCEQWL
jgi:hypothetical protein